MTRACLISDRGLDVIEAGMRRQERFVRAYLGAVLTLFAVLSAIMVGLATH